MTLSTGLDEPWRRAIGVIRNDLARSRAERYVLNMRGLARRRRLLLLELLEFDAEPAVPAARLIWEATRLRASVIVAPSVAHVSGAERELTRRFDLYVVARGRAFVRGHRWPETPKPPRLAGESGR